MLIFLCGEKFADGKLLESQDWIVLVFRGFASSGLSPLIGVTIRESCLSLPGSEVTDSKWKK